MKKKGFVTSSRQKTPWSDSEYASPMQEFIDREIRKNYETKHVGIKASGEAELLNSYKPKKCPYCGFEGYVKFGKDSNGINRYKCKACGKHFKITTGTIFQDRSIVAPVPARTTKRYVEASLLISSGTSMSLIIAGVRAQVTAVITTVHATDMYIEAAMFFRDVS